MSQQEKGVVEAECRACGATGLYRGFAEPKGVAVVCIRCDGSGKITISYIPFTQRKTREGVTTVQRSRGAFLPTGVGPVGKTITYKQFLNGKMP